MPGRGRNQASKTASRRNTPLVSFRLSGWPDEAKHAVLAAGNRSEYLRQAVEFHIRTGPVLTEIAQKLTRIERLVQALDTRVAAIEERLARVELGPPKAPADTNELVRKQANALARWALAADDE